ncbi:ABC transporter substrate-binding protein [Halanaerobium kushneri]|jgi:multiple sugar transport system substrate-binding protein|uniref:Carbohydrate ABC transporter substrate-binding protein, CUT1 family n=1 Tax=Halanaerobium kushneri TaxID=56779 RepID=A0A1N6ZX38_9FIRM|nr:sugar ABC transporter substrate-binding protein [Halanaerobium kushneri]SIR31361.1 carbohydrate ABC transporter substrate-binding protein, CUT1 family [Halanaerobium kushneri]
MKKTFVFSSIFLVSILLLATLSVAAQTTIRVVLWDYEMSPEYHELINTFEEKNPDIDVEVVDVTSQDYGDKLTVMLSGGEDLDVFAVKDMPGYSNFISMNHLEPLNDYIERDNLDTSIYSGLMEEIKIDGEYYAIPFRTDNWILFYNKDIFDAAGVEYPTNDMTWPEFREKAAAVTSGSGSDKTYGAFIQPWMSLATNLGVLKEEGATTLANGEDYDFLKPGYELYLKMQYEDESVMPYGEATTSSAHYRTQFESGKVGMVYIGTWNIGALISDKKAGRHDVNWGIAKSPHWADMEEPDTAISIVTPMAINSNSDKKEEAWKFIKFAGSEEGAKIFAKHGVLPAVKTKDVLDVYTSADGFPENSAAALEAKKLLLEFPPAPNAGVISSIIQEEHELIMLDEVSIDEGIDNIERRIDMELNW